MRVPCVIVDRLDEIERMVVRTALRKACFSTVEVGNSLVVVTGHIDAVRLIAHRNAPSPARVRKTEVDGEEIKGADAEPGQYKLVIPPGLV